MEISLMYIKLNDSKHRYANGYDDGALDIQQLLFSIEVRAVMPNNSITLGAVATV
jgi:hypothetical protein